MKKSATAVAHPNIAFIKYWGNKDHALRIPANGSISMSLETLKTETNVTFQPHLREDGLTINGRQVGGKGLSRVSRMLDRVRGLSGGTLHARVTSQNDFPMGSGIASSASAFAALSLAASAAAGLRLSEKELSRLARTGSGSACRSVPGGFVEWQAGTSHGESYAYTIADQDHWELVDHVAVISTREKKIGSTEGHQLADTSPLQESRVADASRRLDRCRGAILDRNFGAFAEVVELDSNMMHAVMMTSHPPLLYWHPGTLEVMREVRRWRQEGIPVCYTVDAGPNVHVLSLGEYSHLVEDRLGKISSVKDVLISPPGGGASLLSLST